MRRIGFASIVLGLSLLAANAVPAWAETPTTICVPGQAGVPLVSGTSSGKCTKENYKPVALPGPTGLAQLLKLLPHVSYVEQGIGGKPTIKISGANVQVVNGTGKTETINGEGNLVIGYDENEGKHAQTGSHNLILGEEQAFTSYGGILGGSRNSLTAPFASITGGESNTASKAWASVSGGFDNVASGENSSVSGGGDQRALGGRSWVGGGRHNTAGEPGEFDSVSGGEGNTANGEDAASVSGGRYNAATGGFASVSGGYGNTASGHGAAVSGGQDNLASGYNEVEERRAFPAWIGGGDKNTASGIASSIFGGKELTASGEYEAIP
jgi:trimeric autotransporter adhesin